MTPIETMPLPDDPTLAAYAAVLNETGHWASIRDAQWRFVYETDELRRSNGEQFDSAVQRLGDHDYGPSAMSLMKTIYFGDWTESVRRSFRQQGPFILSDTPGGRDELRRVVDPALRDLVEALLRWTQIGHRAGCLRGSSCVRTERDVR